MFKQGFLKRVMQVALAVVCFAGGVVQSWAAPNPNAPMPSAEMILARIWKNMELQAFTLSGVIRTDKKTHPITMKTLGREIVYEALETPLQIRVQFTMERSILSTRRSSQDAWKDLPASKGGEAVLGSDITYEELGLDFLNWPLTQEAGADSIKTLRAYALDAYPEGRPSRYKKIRYWVSADHFLLIRADAYNDKDEVVKRVEVNGVQKIGNAWAIKEMQIASMIPGRELSRSRTYLEIRSGQAGVK